MIKLLKTFVFRNCNNEHFERSKNFNDSLLGYSTDSKGLLESWRDVNFGNFLDQSFLNSSISKRFWNIHKNVIQIFGQIFQYLLQSSRYNWRKFSLSKFGKFDKWFLDRYNTCNLFSWMRLLRLLALVKLLVLRSNITKLLHGLNFDGTSVKLFLDKFNSLKFGNDNDSNDASEISLSDKSKTSISCYIIKSLCFDYRFYRPKYLLDLPGSNKTWEGLLNFCLHNLSFSGLRYTCSCDNKKLRHAPKIDLMRIYKLKSHNQIQKMRFFSFFLPNPFTMKYWEYLFYDLLGANQFLNYLKIDIKNPNLFT